MKASLLSAQPRNVTFVNGRRRLLHSTLELSHLTYVAVVLKARTHVLVHDGAELLRVVALPARAAATAVRHEQLPTGRRDARVLVALAHYLMRGLERRARERRRGCGVRRCGGGGALTVAVKSWQLKGRIDGCLLHLLLLLLLLHLLLNVGLCLRQS